MGGYELGVGDWFLEYFALLVFSSSGYGRLLHPAHTPYNAGDAPYFCEALQSAVRSHHDCYQPIRSMLWLFLLELEGTNQCNMS